MKPDYSLIIKMVGFNFSCDEEKLSRLPIEPTEIEIEKLSWHLNVPFLWSRGSNNNLAPLQVIKYPHAHEEEHARTRHANLNQPIDIMETDGRWIILNGLHRLMKAHILKLDTVKVRKIPASEIPNISE